MSLKDLMHSMIGMQPNISATNAINIKFALLFFLT